MEKCDVDSSMIRCISYEASNATLEIEFKSGPVWQYFDFPESLWCEFKGAESKGKYFLREIKNKYTESQIG